LHGQLRCVRYIAVQCYLVFSLLFLPFSFSEVETASEMTKTMLEWVFYLLTLVNFRICELTKTVDTVTESKTCIREFREHCSLPL